MGLMSKGNRRGNCYVCTESLYFLLGGRRSGWKPMVMRLGRDTHWFLLKKSRTGDIILDPTVSQFKTKPDYSKARGCGFLTRRPSRRARDLMKRMVWQDVSQFRTKPDCTKAGG